MSARLHAQLGEFAVHAASRLRQRPCESPYTMPMRSPATVKVGFELKDAVVSCHVRRELVNGVKGECLE